MKQRSTRNRHGNSADSPFGPLHPPQPSASLEARVLGAARQALADSPSAAVETIWDRLWDSRPLRFAWVASLALVLAGHLSVGSGEHATTPASTLARVDVGDLPEFRLEAVDLFLVPRL